MASTVYYGKSTTAAGTKAKVVKLQLTQEELSRLQEELSQDGIVVEESLLFNSGDELVVHFAHANTVDSPSLVLSIGDSNEEISISTDSGKSIHSNSPTPAVAGCWDTGEVVTFVYTVSETLTGAAASNEAYWVMDDGGLADKDTYGVTKLVDTDFDNTGRDDSSAITLGGVKYLLNNIQGNTLTYTPKVSTGTELGTITLDGEWIEPQSVTIWAPAQSALPSDRDLSKYDNTNSQFITSAPLSGYVPTSRKINNKALTGDISLTYSDVSAASSGHTHTTSIQTYSGTPLIALAHGGKYSITAGGTSYSFSLPTVSSVAVPYFKIVTVYTKNIQYPGTSPVPQAVYYNGAHPSDAIEVQKYPEDGIVNTTLLRALVPSYSGYKFVGVLGYNVNRAGKKQDGTEYQNKEPELINVWSCAPGRLRSGTYTSVNLEMYNSRASTNTVYLSLTLLYISSTFASIS